MGLYSFENCRTTQKFFIVTVFGFLPKVLFIMFNPSEANQKEDDQTIRRVIDFSTRWGFGGVYVGNIFSYISKNPKNIKVENPHFNDKNIKSIVKMEKDSFKTILVSGQNSVFADNSTDTLTLVAGSNMTLTTNAGGDTVTFASSGSGGGSASASDIRTKFVYTTTGSTTAFSGSDDNSATLSYTLGAVDVYLNGVLQKLTTDYAETNTSTITFANAIASGNVVEIIAFYRTIGTGNSVVNQFTGNASATDFTVTTAPESENNLLVYIDGVYQQKTDYTVSGTTLAFDTAPANGAVIETVAMVGAITSQANLTLTGELDVVTLDVSGNGDIDGNLLVGGNLSLDGLSLIHI